MGTTHLVAWRAPSLPHSSLLVGSDASGSLGAGAGGKARMQKWFSIRFFPLQQSAKRPSWADSAVQTLAVCSNSCREEAGDVQVPSAPELLLGLRSWFGVGSGLQAPLPSSACSPRPPSHSTGKTPRQRLLPGGEGPRRKQWGPSEPVRPGSWGAQGVWGLRGLGSPFPGNSSEQGCGRRGWGAQGLLCTCAVHGASPGIYTRIKANISECCLPTGSAAGERNSLPARPLFQDGKAISPCT